MVIIEVLPEKPNVQITTGTAAFMWNFRRCEFPCLDFHTFPIFVGHRPRTPRGLPIESPPGPLPCVGLREMMCNLRCNTRLVVHETFDKGTNAEYAGLPRMSRYFKICQDMSRYVKICQERTASNWVRWSTATPQVEVEDFVKRAKSLTKEIEELWLMEWGDAQGEMIWRWLSKTCFFNQQNWQNLELGYQGCRLLTHTHTVMHWTLKPFHPSRRWSVRTSGSRKSQRTRRRTCRSLKRWADVKTHRMSSSEN